MSGGKRACNGIPQFHPASIKRRNSTAKTRSRDRYRFNTRKHAIKRVKIARSVPQRRVAAVKIARAIRGSPQFLFFLFFIAMQTQLNTLLLLRRIKFVCEGYLIIIISAECCVKYCFMSCDRDATIILLTHMCVRSSRNRRLLQKHFLKLDTIMLQR